MQIHLLGGVSALTSDDELIDIGPAKCQALLAALALSVGSAVSVDRLVDLIWDEEPPRTAPKTLQTYVARLRKALGPDAVARVGAAYRLDIPRQAVDAMRFQDHVGAGDTARAIAEWSGQPLAGLDTPGLRGAVEALVEQWLGAIEAELTSVVEHDPPAAIATLTELTTDYPFREGLWALLMKALYRSGRQADALAAYGRARTHLVEELGIEPGPALREVEALVLGQDDRLASPAHTVAAPTGTVTFAFSDIEGSSELWAEHRHRMAAAVERHDELVRAEVATHLGYVFSTGGDSFGVAFHRASEAASWALAVHSALAAEPWPEGVNIRVRVGLHTGEADERGGDYFGPTVNIAARVAAAGHGGQTVLSGVAASLLDRPDIADLGRFRLDGVATELVLYQLGPGAYPPLRTEEKTRGNLPRRMGRLHGRGDELDLVESAVQSAPIVTLVGPGGIGKTTLAMAAARRSGVDFAGGKWLVELADLTSNDEVPRAVADALGANERPGRSLSESVVAHLKDQAALVALDNCEHVVDGAAELANLIARSCPDVRILATSREGLGVADERIVVVGPLDPSGAAVDLFAERATEADADFRLDRDREVVEEICRRLDGVPLAIEIAAARLRGLSPADLVERLDDRLRLLTGGRRRSVERHRTLRATIQWSYDLLTPFEQTILCRLSIFAGSFDLEAAERTVADGEVQAVDVAMVLGDLVDRSMVVVEPGAFGRRYRLLETMRQFGAEQLSELEDPAGLASRHASWVTGEVEQLGVLLFSNQELEGAALLAELWPNVRAAVDWGFVVEDRDLVTTLLRPIVLQAFVRRDLGEIADWVERLLKIIPADDVDATAEALLWLALPYSMTQQRERFRQLIADCGAPDHLFVEYARLMGVEDEDYGALVVGPKVVAEMRRRGHETFARLFDMFTGGALLSAGRLDDMDKALSRLAVTFRREGPPSFLNWTLFLLGAGAAMRGDHDATEEYWSEVANIAVPPRTNSPNETLSARAAFRQGRRHEAYDILRRYIDDVVRAENMAGVAVIGIEYVNMMVGLGRLHDAAVILGHFDTTGLLQVEGPGFKVFIAEAIEVVAADPAAAATQAKAAADQLHERDALDVMRAVLTELLVADHQSVQQYER